MTASHLSGPLLVGTVPVATQKGGTVNTTQGNQGSALLVQSVTVQRDATLVQTASFTVPQNATLVGFDVFTDVAYDSATSATLTVGKSAAATDYVTSMNVKTAGYQVGVHTAANTGNMANVGSVAGNKIGVPIFATVTSVGQPSVGTVRVVCYYVQN